MSDPVSPLAIAANSSGVSIEEIAALLDINLPWAWDLWTDKEDDEIYTLTLGKLQSLVPRLHVEVTALVYESPGPARRRASLDELAMDARVFCDTSKLSMDEFSDLVGWEMQVFFDRTDSAWEDWNLEWLKDVCGVLGLHWPDYFPNCDFKLSDSVMESVEAADLAAWRALSYQQFAPDHASDDEFCGPLGNSPSPAL